MNKKVLSTKARDNHGYTYETWLQMQPDHRGIPRWVFGCEAGGGWYLSDLLERSSNQLAIDFGQGWYIINMLELLTESRELLGL